MRQALARALTYLVIAALALLWLVPILSTALVAAMVARLMLFPAGALATIPGLVRFGALAIGLVVFYRTGRTPWTGVCAGAVAIALGKFAVG